MVCVWKFGNKVLQKFGLWGSHPLGARMGSIPGIFYRRAKYALDIMYRAHRFPREICQIPQARSRNSAAQRGKIVQIPQLATAYHFMTKNWKSCSETSVIEGWHCTEG